MSSQTVVTPLPGRLFAAETLIDNLLVKVASLTGKRPSA